MERKDADTLSTAENIAETTNLYADIRIFSKFSNPDELLQFGESKARNLSKRSHFTTKNFW